MIGKLKLELKRILTFLLSKLDDDVVKEIPVDLSKEEEIKLINELQAFIMKQINYQKVLYYNSTLDRQKFEMLCEVEKFLFELFQDYKQR